MDWGDGIDLGLGVFTGGAWTVGKTIWNAGEAAESVGTAANHAASAAAVASETIARVGASAQDFLKASEHLLTVERTTPRDFANLWQDEKERLTKARKRLDDLRKGPDPLGQIRAFLGWTPEQKEINSILYQEPGVATNAIHYAQLVLERLFAQEQPRIDKVLESANDALIESAAIEREVKKLFIEESQRQIPHVAMASWVLPKVTELNTQRATTVAQMENTSAVINELQAELLKVTPRTLKLPTEDQPPQHAVDHTILERLDAQLPLASRSLVSQNEKLMGPALKQLPISERMADSEDIRSAKSNADNSTSYAALRPQLQSIVNQQVASRAASLASQPQAVKIGAALNQNDQRGLRDNLVWLTSIQQAHLDQLRIIDKQIVTYTTETTYSPGIIPIALKTLNQAIGDIDGVAVEFKSTLSGVNAIIRAISASVSNNRAIIKFGILALGGLILANLLAGVMLIVKHLLST